MKPQTLEEACTTLTAALVDFLELLGRARDEPQPATRLYTYAVCTGKPALYP